jgi:myosin protein heavy chain
MLKAGKQHEEVEMLNEKIKGIEENLHKEEQLRKQLEACAAKLEADKNELLNQLEAAKGNTAQVEGQLSSLNTVKTKLEQSLNEANDKLVEQEERTAEVNRAKKKVEQDCDKMKKNIGDLEQTLKKAEQEKQNKENQIRVSLKIFKTFLLKCFRDCKKRCIIKMK